MPRDLFSVTPAAAFLAASDVADDAKAAREESRQRDRREAKRTAAVEGWQARRDRMSPQQRLEDEFAMLDEMERDSAGNLQRCEQEFEKLMRGERR